MEKFSPIDISLPLKAGMITYPGNPELSLAPAPTTSENILTQIVMGSHTGTHIDAPSHSIRGRESIDELFLEIFHGPARVLDLSHVAEMIRVPDLEAKNIQAGERILLRTSNSQRGFEEFFPDFVSLAPVAAEFLASIGVVLVGIDSLSIKQKGNPDNRPHTVLLEKGIPILEGLDLSQAEEGEYTLSALPLKFIDIDGSPCRAVLYRQ